MAKSLPPEHRNDISTRIRTPITGSKEMQMIEDTLAGPPWEQAGMPARQFVRTVVAVLLHPFKTFQRIEPVGECRSAAIFGVIAGSLGLAAFAILTQLYIFWVMPEKRGSLNAMTLALTAIAVWLAAVVVVAMKMAIGTFLLHQSLRILGGAKQPMIATFRTVAYAQAAFTVWCLIPLVGLPLATLHFLIVVGIGLATLHGAAIVRVIAAELLALLLPAAIAIGSLVLFSS